MDEKTLAAILDAYPYEVVYVDRTHVVRYLNRTARERYGERVCAGDSIMACHNERSRGVIERFLAEADAGDLSEKFESLNPEGTKRTFFVPVADAEGRVIGYFERHEVRWDEAHANEAPGAYWE